jgi:hypothetical protein
MAVEVVHVVVDIKVDVDVVVTFKTVNVVKEKLELAIKKRSGFCDPSLVAITGHVKIETMAHI